jgi:subtilase family serine protease
MTFSISSVLRLATLGLLSFAAASGAWGQAHNRIVQPIDDARLATVSGTVHPSARPEFDQGAVNSAMRLEAMSLNFQPSAQQQAELDQLLQEQQTPASPNYHHWLTQEEFGNRFGMSPDDISKVTAWLAGHGFQVLEVAPSRNSIRFAGTAGMVAQAFHTQLHHYLVEGKTHFANASEVQLPEAFASSVVHVGGLNDFRPKARVRNRHVLAPGTSQRSANPNFTSGISGKTFLAPGDFAVIYDVQPLYDAGYTGAGQQIAVAGQTNIHTDDIAAFRSAAGLTAANLTPYCISSSEYCTGDASYAGSDPTSGDEVEADLDVEWSGAVAKDATVNFIFASYSDPTLAVMDALSYAINTYKVNGAVVPIISVSYGDCEADFGSQLSSLRNDAQEANAQGQTLLGPAGDSGAADCEASGATVATHGLAVDAPASFPEFTSVGGAEFLADVSDPSAYWTNAGCTNCTDTLTSALSYIPEEVWNDTVADGELSAGGGGVSAYYSLPTWQQGLNPPGFTGTPMRFVPDLSLNASDDHDQYLICSQVYSDSNAAQGTWCTNGLRNSGTYLDTVGGTSGGVPSFAGILSLLEQKTGETAGLGNINPVLYAVAQDATAAAFHDITTGNNEVPCRVGRSGCPASGSIGYVAGPGYDLASGWGSIDADGLATALLDYKFPNRPATATALAPTSTGNVYQGVAVPLTATVTSTTAGAITGTVAFTAGTTALGKAPLSGTPATATLNVTTAQTTALSTGAITITAAYEGDTNYAESTGTQQVTVLPMPSVSIASSAMAIASNASGSAGTSTITVTSVNAFAGTVDFSNATVSMSPQLSASTGFSPNTLNLTSGSAATDTFTLTLSAVAQVRPETPSWARHRRLPFAGAVVMLAGAWFLLPWKRRKHSRLLALLLVAALATGLSCGGGSNNSSSTAPTPTPTPTPTATPTPTPTPSPTPTPTPTATTYTVTVGNIVATDPASGTQSTLSTSFTLTVQ